LLNEDGEKIPVTGQDGKDAVAPQVRINTETNVWEISNDGGTTWTSTGVVATGDSGTSIYDDVKPDSSSNTVTITLVNGTSFTIPMADVKVARTAPRPRAAELYSSQNNIEPRKGDTFLIILLLPFSRLLQGSLVLFFIWQGGVPCHFVLSPQ